MNRAFSRKNIVLHDNMLATLEKSQTFQKVTKLKFRTKITTKKFAISIYWHTLVHPYLEIILVKQKKHEVCKKVLETLIEGIKRIFEESLSFFI